MNLGTPVKGKRIDTGEWELGVLRSKKEFNPRRGRLRDQSPEWHHYLCTCYDELVEVEAIKLMEEDKV